MIPNEILSPEGQEKASKDNKPFVELLTPTEPDISFLTRCEQQKGIDAFINIRGPEAAGKTTLWRAAVDKFGDHARFTPEAMTRQPRPAYGNLRAEINGLDLIYIPDPEFDQALSDNSFLFAYRVWSQRVDPVTHKQHWRQKRAGLLKSTILEAVRSEKRSLLVIPPSIDRLLSRIFPLTLCLHLQPSQEDWEHYCQERGLDPVLDSQSNREKEFEEYHAPGTHILINPRYQFNETLKVVERLIRRRRALEVVKDGLPIDQQNMFDVVMSD